MEYVMTKQLNIIPRFVGHRQAAVETASDENPFTIIRKGLKDEIAAGKKRRRMLYMAMAGMLVAATVVVGVLATKIATYSLPNVLEEEFINTPNSIDFNKFLASQF